MEALEEIAAEKQRRAAGSFAVTFDDRQTDGELVDAAISYALVACMKMPDEIRNTHFKTEPPILWPWDRTAWKPQDRRADLIHAAVLILAEIERFDRQPGSGHPNLAAAGAAAE